MSKKFGDRKGVAFRVIKLTVTHDAFGRPDLKLLLEVKKVYERAVITTYPEMIEPQLAEFMKVHAVGAFHYWYLGDDPECNTSIGRWAFHHFDGVINERAYFNFEILQEVLKNA